MIYSVGRRFNVVSENTMDGDWTKRACTAGGEKREKRAWEFHEWPRVIA